MINCYMVIIIICTGIFIGSRKIRIVSGRTYLFIIKNYKLVLMRMGFYLKKSFLFFGGEAKGKVPPNFVNFLELP